MEKISNEEIQDCRELVKRFIDRICPENTINVNNINIDITIDDRVFVEKSKLTISYNLFEITNKPIRDFALAHEMGHYINEDYKQARELNFKVLYCNDSYKVASILKEVRADLTGKNLNDGKYEVDMFQCQIDSYKYGYPSQEDRISFVKNFNSFNKAAFKEVLRICKEKYNLEYNMPIVNNYVSEPEEKALSLKEQLFCANKKIQNRESDSLDALKEVIFNKFDINNPLKKCF